MTPSAKITLSVMSLALFVLFVFATWQHDVMNMIIAFISNAPISIILRLEERDGR